MAWNVNISQKKCSTTFTLMWTSWKKSCSQTRKHFMSRIKFTGIMCAYGAPKTHMLLGSRHAPQNMPRDRILFGCYPCYQRSPHRGLLRSVKNAQSFAVICCKPHVASSICLSAPIFQNPEWTLWTHCTFGHVFLHNEEKMQISDKYPSKKKGERV
jgi:hypothetical protein